ncbi:MAG: hypothetical protein KDA42_12855 [Planctomycetales bacterium]|nr:hypothetical protein [Planctomycetales bacterium]
MALRRFGRLVAMCCLALGTAWLPSQVQANDNPYCVCSSDDGGFYAGGEVVLLRPYSQLGYTTDGYHVPDSPGVRVWTGYEAADGLGIRFRYFDLDATAPNDGDITGIDVQYFDLEATTELEFCHTQFELSGGVRFANFKSYWAGTRYSDLDERGLTFGIQMERNVCRDLSLFGWFQESLLFGDDADNYTGYMQRWTELQLGLQYDRCICGRNVYVRGGVEAQYHTGVYEDNHYDSSLFGYFAGAGVSF